MQINRQLLSDSWHSWVSNDNRPRAGPWWLQWVWTLLFSAALAVPITLLGLLAAARGEGAWLSLTGWREWYGRNLIVCLSISILIHLLFDLTRLWPATPKRLAHWRPWQHKLYFAGLPLLGLLLGWPLGAHLAGADVGVWVGSRNGIRILIGSALIALMLTVLVYLFFSIKTRQIDAERRASEAQLQLLQAQIEPHFLFNTLANVVSLIDHDAPKAKQMLSTFTDYLRASLFSLRHAQASLDCELDLVTAYLDLLKQRMEDRLDFRIDAAPELRHTKLPPLLLQPLVENAIHHGLEPQVAGGKLEITVRRERNMLVLGVHDNGVGLGASPRRRGAGMALNNLRERLQAHYGARASLRVEAAHPGTQVTLRVPFEALPAHTGAIA